MDLSKFHVICVISNPVRYASRYRLYEVFKKEIENNGAQLWTVELQTGSPRVHKVTEKENPRHIQVWNSGLPGILWTKEQLQNLAVQQLTVKCPDWRYVCFIDADIRVREDFIAECQHLLQLHPIAQPWSHSVDKAPDGSAIGEKMQLSFAYCHVNDIKMNDTKGYFFGGHPGYILCMRREAYSDLGGLIDIAICGSGDRHQMTGIVGQIQNSYHPKISEGYKEWLHQWEARALKYLKRNLGYLPNIVTHEFHGAKKNRFYGDRWKILTNWQFCPYSDLKKDSSGLWQLVVENDRQIGLRDALYKYFRSRQEDSNSL